MGLSPRYDAGAAERRWQATWAQLGLHEFDPRDPRPLFAIDTPPPTVSGELHIGHVYSYVQAEAMARFWRMRGYNVYYPFGFDDNGLPTERYVEKLRGVRARDLSRGEFIAMCLEVSQAVEDRFEAFWKRLGFSADWRLRYSTIDPQARRISQWSFLDLYRQGLIYRAQAPNPWCVECQTAIAQAEMDDAERATVFYTLAFAIEDERRMNNDEGGFAAGEPSSFVLDSSSSLPIATTRPELLPACVAVLVHPDDARYAALIGHSAIVPLFGRQVPIVADAAVDPQKGSGAVMCCTFGDATDVAWWQAHALPLIPLLTRAGRLGADGGAYAGLTLAQARQRIVADLGERGLLLGQQASRQSVRIHDRCKTPLEILETSQWFVRVLDAKPALLAAGRAIEWHPAHMQARYEHWVANLGWDWCISRQRFYGVPFPAWHCGACGAVVLADESQLPVDPTSAAPPRACACGNADLRPDTDVMDTWATSSVSPLIAALRWDDVAGERQGAPIGERARATQLLPMHLRPQAHDIIRTWAFYAIVKSHYHFGRTPWSTVMISGHGLDPSGHSIHKSLGNSPITPEALIARHSADAVRYWACSGSVGADQSIDEATMRQGVRLANKLWSAARLIEAQLADGEPAGSAALWWSDRALLSWLQRLVGRVTASFEGYEYAAALDATERFFWNTFCDNYLEWVKSRLYDAGGAERDAARLALARTLRTILKLLAPVLPFVAEEIYQQLFAADGERSIHTSAWPAADQALIDPAAERAGEALLALTGAVRRFKSSQQLGLAAPLARLTIAAEAEVRDQLAACAADIRSVTRAQSLAFADTPADGFEQLGPGLWLTIER
ncbi:MAG TPA: valine--tRNA ligase [Kouleothrix sp.]|uniref:valine--tRNA ligase n=1 Tax=Kouleothrix sp. TaxID=2779161 RepID=UPI002D0354E8|nr:valine--tRNA ligase [Kouleothrix sp.]